MFFCLSCNRDSSAGSRTDFLITASQDGHVKFWKKKEDEGIEFVKHFRSHLGMKWTLTAAAGEKKLQISAVTNALVSSGVMEGIAVSAEGALFCSIGDDQAMKVFDVVNFDMINMLKLG